jgi:dethiobiotin synthetase
VNANLKNTPFLINGLSSCGKTTFICGLLKIGLEKQLNFAGFKPFDTGLMKRNASEQYGDGEIYLNYMAGEPMEGLVSPYVAHENYPVEMAFRRDGISVNEHFLKDRVKTLYEHYSRIFIESPGSLFMPITEKKQYYQWMLSISNSIIWIMDLCHEQFTHNLAELLYLKNLDCNITLIFNNCRKNQDQDLMFYLWEKMESSLELQAAGMIPYISNGLENICDLADKMEENLPVLINSMLNE